MKVLVTGGTSLLGSSVADRLAARGDSVTVLQRRPSGLPHREVLADITDRGAVGNALRGHDAVVHLAAKVDIQGRYREFAHTNIGGTRVVVEACRRAQVPRLVHVSTPSVAHSGTPLIGAPAGRADPHRARGHYARSKAVAELHALAADAAPGGPATVVVRPHLVWGPGDTQLVGRIIARARAGRLPVVGSGAALIDTTYITNAADAIVAALDRCSQARGHAFVVSNGEPRPVAELLAAICRAAGVRSPRRAVSATVAKVAGAIVEAAWTLRPAAGDPPMTRFLAEQLSTAHWFDQRRTAELLGWTPRVSLDAGLAALAASCG
ncbi:MAG: NAD-dependent epimerase/dehydratase family protein [Pseudonocardia sp.]|nr:NAD-dependent epimerase/dehydratase family protein [Pseudonocardia sp.]